jgi:tryptophan 2,3-dioxygenase
MKKSVIAVLILAGVMLANEGVLFAQDSANSTVTDQDVQLLRKDLRSQKKQLIAANLPLTDAEAVKFWPVYDQYQAEITKIGDTRFALIKEYAANYNTLTDTQAYDLITRMIGVDESLVQLRQKYVPIVEKVLPGKKTAMFFQMEKRVALMIDLQLASMIPIVQP